jgi:hypothetical protein
MRRLFYRVWDNLKRDTTTVPSHLQSFTQQSAIMKLFHPSAIDPSWSSELQKSEARGAEQRGIEALLVCCGNAQAGLELLVRLYG